MAAAPPETLALPRPDGGLTDARVAAWFDGRVPAHVYVDQGELRGVEWSEPAGRYAMVEYRRGRAWRANVRRPWVGLLPAVEARRLPALRIGQTSADVSALAGAGWPVARTYVADDVSSETRGWSIRDRGLGTGRTLFVTFVSDTVAAIAHPWVSR